ncbi:gephyrin-like molybdotransferase Glp [Phosphitispora sp. TUW77]|uniref:molybdopterin molybdotransferase MoeA n=1 Tax=Phosphitispora sp. TUW77 TaxID=3152361 RepID=UPI003AB119DB
MRELISLEEAVAMIIAHTKIVGKEEISLLSALGRVLSEDIFAPISIPPFNRSPLDGYALRAKDIEKADLSEPVELEVSQEIQAGNYSDIEVKRNKAVKILTGAPIPPGADVVIRFEDVEKTGSRIKVFKPLTAYSNYCFAGEDVFKGEMVVSAGTVINPEIITVLAGLGIGALNVYCIPKITIISTGNELVDINEQLFAGKIYNSNLYAIAAEVRRMGAMPVHEGIVGDQIDLIAEKIDVGLKSSDMVITTGGVSVGDYDLVKQAITSLGANIVFHGVNMRPGTPAICAVKNGKIIIGLSGNPGAAYVSYHLIAKPAIFKLMGLDKWQPASSTAVLQDDYPKVSKQRRFLKGQVYLDDGIVKVSLTGKQNPGIIKSMINCNALVDVPANTIGLKAGNRVNVVLLH